MFKRAAMILGAAAIAAACTSTTGGTPHPATPAPTSSPPHAAASATPAPAPPSDDEQIRQTLHAIDDALNSENYDAYLDLLCAPMRAKFVGITMDYLKKMRTRDGITTIVAINSVTIHGDEAEVSYQTNNETRGPASASLPFKHENDGWKMCTG